ncbi:helix-turn-helix domain-containing protein [Lactococcus lactis]
MKQKSQNYGSCFKELRQLAAFKYKDLEAIMSKTGIVKFENGTSNISFEKLAELLKFMGYTLSDFMYLSGESRVDEVYGEKFHIIRYQQGYRDDFFIPVGVNPVRLSLFESGKILLPYDVIDAMLGLMHIPEQDFSYIINGSKDDYFVHYINWLDRIQLREEFAEAEMIQNEAHKYANNQEIKVKILEENFETLNYNNEWLELHSQERLTRQYTDYRVLELTAKACHQILNDEEVTEIGDFLFGIELWLEYSLGILALNAWQLPYSLVYAIISDINLHEKEYKGKLIYRRRIVQTAGRCAMTLISRGEIQKASALLSMVHHYAEALDTHVQGLYRFAWAYLDYRNGKIEGQKEMLRVIALFDFLEVPISRDFAQKYYNRHVLNLEES